MTAKIYYLGFYPLLQNSIKHSNKFHGYYRTCTCTIKLGGRDSLQMPRPLFFVQYFITPSSLSSLSPSLTYVYMYTISSFCTLWQNYMVAAMLLFCYLHSQRTCTLQYNSKNHPCMYTRVTVTDDCRKNT